MCNLLLTQCNWLGLLAACISTHSHRHIISSLLHETSYFNTTLITEHSCICFVYTTGSGSDSAISNVITTGSCCLKRMRIIDDSLSTKLVRDNRTYRECHNNFLVSVIITNVVYHILHERFNCDTCWSKEYHKLLHYHH